MLCIVTTTNEVVLVELSVVSAKGLEMCDGEEPSRVCFDQGSEELKDAISSAGGCQVHEEKATSFIIGFTHH